MIFSAISSLVSGVINTISSAVSSIGSALSSFVSGVGTVIGEIIETIKPMAGTIVSFANDFLQMIGVLRPNEDVKDIGERALQAAEKDITIDKFDDFDAYKQALLDFPLDPEKASQRSDSLKLVAGLGVLTVGVEKKFNAEPGSLQSMWLLPIANPDYFTPERMHALLAARRLGEPIMDYLEKRLSAFESRAFEDGLAINNDGSLMNESEKRNLYESLDQAKSNWQHLRDEVRRFENARNQNGPE